MMNNDPSRLRNAATDLALMLASGGLLAIAMPPRNVGVLAWVALVPLLRLRRHAESTRLCAAGYLLALVPTVSVVYAMGVLDASRRFFVTATLGAPLLFAAAIVLASAVERRLGSSIVRIFVFPGLAVVVEYALRCVLGGLLVPSLAWTQSAESVLVQSSYALQSNAPVTFLIVLVNVGLEDAFAWAKGRFGDEGPALRRLAPACVVLAIFSGNAAYGFHRLAMLPEAAAPARKEASARRTADQGATADQAEIGPSGPPQHPQ